jgi:hypothetical protein
MKIKCPYCGEESDVPDGMEGKYVKCVSCEEFVHIKDTKAFIPVENPESFADKTIPPNILIEQFIKHKENNDITLEEVINATNGISFTVKLFGWIFGIANFVFAFILADNEYTKIYFIPIIIAGLLCIVAGNYLAGIIILLRGIFSSLREAIKELKNLKKN